MRKLLLILVLLVIPVFAAAEQQRVFDNADIFTESECERLEEAITNFRKETKTDLTVLITDDYLGPASPENIAKYFYETMDFGMGANNDGAIINLDMNKVKGGMLVIVGYGFWEDLLTDDNKARVMNSVLQNEKIMGEESLVAAFIGLIDEMLVIYNEYWSQYLE